MPEYLAPGVYVEETSFRSKSIEGVSTSTTAFAGPARRGPVTNDVDRSLTPELITSLADFERVFGGFGDLTFGGKARTNYLTHAVKAFFDNGGSRLYVARVLGGDPAQPDGPKPARSTSFAAGPARFEARFPGTGGNGRVVLSLGFSPLRERTWNNAPLGTVVRTSDGSAPTSARLTGRSLPRLFVRDGETLQFTLGTTARTVTFRGATASVRVTPALDPTTNTVAIIAAAPTVWIEVDGLAQTLTLTDGGRTLAQIAAEINDQMVGGSVRVDEDGLVLTTDTRGTAASIAVREGALGVVPEVANIADASNNVRNLIDLDLDDLTALLGAGVTVEFIAGDSEDERRLRLSTAPGVALTITGGTARAALGLGEGDPEVLVEQATSGTPATFAVKTTEGQGLPEGEPQLVSLAITAIDADGSARAFDGLGLDHRHPRFIGKVLPAAPSRRTEQLENVFAFISTGEVDGGAWATELAAASGSARRTSTDDEPDRIEREVRLADGTDGAPPTQADFRIAFKVLDRIEDISIVAAPGYSAYEAADAIEQELIIHVERRRAYRIGVLDSRPGQSIGEVRQTKAALDSKHAALYYPWVSVANPQWRPGDDQSVKRELMVPPSGFVAGIYARNDNERGVYKTPANEVVRGALRFETDVNFAQQEVLNPLGVNCLRFFPGRGYRVWGGRTLSSDPEWKYVSVRRYFNYIERSIDVSTQWAVFEPNSERLWANIRETITSFLLGEWRSGALLGADPKEAFFVRCDRSTMDQSDLDNGRLVCLIGVAAVKPAEFVIFRVGQKTADARS